MEREEGLPGTRHQEVSRKTNREARKRRRGRSRALPLPPPLGLQREQQILIIRPPSKPEGEVNAGGGAGNKKWEEIQNTEVGVCPLEKEQGRYHFSRGGDLPLSANGIVCLSKHRETNDKNVIN